MYKAVADMRAREDSFESVQKELAGLLHKAVNDAGYFSRKQWRFELIMGVIDELYAYVTAAFSGKASVRRAAESISLAGGDGIGQVSHASLSIEKDIIRHVTYFDIGESRIVNLEHKNDTTVATVGASIFLLSPEYREGTAIGIADVRLVGSGLRAGSAYRIGGDMYRVTKDVTMECTNGKGQEGVKVMKLGKVFRAGGETSCTGGGLALGPKGFKKEFRRLGSLPSVHPTLLRARVDNEDKIPVFQDSDKVHNDRMDDDIRKGVEEAQVMLEELGADNFDQHSHSVTYGALGLVVLILGACSAVLGCWIWRKHRSSSTDAYTYTVRYQNHPPPLRPPRTSSLVVQYGESFIYRGMQCTRAAAPVASPHAQLGYAPFTLFYFFFFCLLTDTIHYVAMIPHFIFTKV
jgi:hypothetical protein